MATVKLILRSKKNSDGTQPICLVFFKGNKKLHITIDSVKPEKWPNKIGKTLDFVISDRLAAAKNLLLLNPDISLEQIKVKLSGNNSNDFYKYAEKYIAQYNNEDQQGTYDGYDAKINLMKKYSPSLTFEQITNEWLRNYETYLKNRGDATNTIHDKLKKIRAIYRSGIKDGLADWTKNPFLHYKLKTAPSKKERLTENEINRIRIAPAEGNEDHARNVFLFQFNCMGMRIGDVLRLRPGDVKDLLQYQMKKTGDMKGIRLTPEAKEILDKYCQDKKSQFIFPFLKEDTHKGVKAATANVNKHLKLFCKEVGITKTVSTHVSRHTWTQRALTKGVNRKLIQQGLGHKSSRTTDIYTADLDTSLLDDANELIVS